MTIQEDPLEWMLRGGDNPYWMDRGIGGIVTDYVRSRVAGRPWDDRFYIYELMIIEELCIRGVKNWDDWVLFGDLRKRHPDEYRAIRTELDPEWPGKERERASEEARNAVELKADHERAKKEVLNRYKRSKEAWLDLGGCLL